MSMRVRTVVLLLITAAIMVAGCASPSLPNVGGGNAATVNGKAISMSDFNKQVTAVTQSMVSQGLDPKTADGKASIEQMREDLLTQMIETEIMRQAAVKEGITVSAADVDARLVQIKQDAGGDELFKKSLDQAKLTEQEFKTLVVSDQIIYERLYDKLTAAMPATAPQVRARHILVASEKEATDVRARLAKGEDFVAVAKAVSTDTQSKDNGGDLGFFPRGVLDTTFEQAVFSLKPQEIATVQTDFGWHVVQVMEVDANRALSPDIKQVLGGEVVNTYLQGLRSQAKVVRLVKFAATPTSSQQP